MKNAALTYMGAEELSLINASQREKAGLTFLLCCQSSSLARVKGNSVSMTHPFLGCCGDSLQLVDWWQLSWGDGDVGTQDHQHISQEPFEGLFFSGKQDQKL